MHAKSFKYRSILFGMLYLIIFGLTSCETGELTEDIIVYSNDFQDRDVTNIEGASFRNSGSQSIGNYNNSGFTLHLNNLPDHNFLFISFDLLIHDTWDGNTNGLSPDAPDKWFMEIDAGLGFNSTDEYGGIETTFSNGPCDNVLCLPQSYPNSFPSHRQPKTGINGRRRGLCALRSDPEGTTVYSVQRTFRHDNPAVIFRFRDELFQSNVQDQLCDESWSMDNIVVRALTVK